MQIYGLNNVCGLAGFYTCCVWRHNYKRKLKKAHWGLTKNTNGAILSRILQVTASKDPKQQDFIHNLYVVDAYQKLSSNKQVFVPKIHMEP